jgi:hypothetical protein
MADLTGTVILFWKGLATSAKTSLTSSGQFWKRSRISTLLKVGSQTILQGIQYKVLINQPVCGLMLSTDLATNVG